MGGNSYSGYSQEQHGGRVLLLFLLFLMALYSMSTSGINGFAMVYGGLPIIILACYLVFKYQMFMFWTLFLINYFVFFIGRMGYLSIPLSLPNEMVEMVLIGLGIINAKIMRFEKVANLMFFSLLVWCAFCTLQVLNDTCGLGINVGNWYAGSRMMAFQLLYAFIVCSIYIETPQRLLTFIRLWAALSIFASVWALKQQYLGFNAAEKAFLVVAARTHMVNGIVRYFSIYSDAANFGCNMAGSAALFIIIGLTTKLKRDKIFFIIAGLFCLKGMFASGTRTAMFCLILGFLVYIFLSKSVKIAVPLIVAGLFFLAFLVFTNIGNGNNQIRRMRSAFKRGDASANARDVNKEAMAKHLKDAPWGIGIGNSYENVPANNKFRKLSVIPPDSEYVFIWVHTGVIGITVFCILTAMMFGGACCVVLFQLKNKSLHGIGAGLCSAFAAIQLGGYGNQILMQFPNVLLFYGGLSLVYVLPLIEKSYMELENKRYAEQVKREQIKREKRLASRV